MSPGEGCDDTVEFAGLLHAQGRIPTPDLRLPLLPASDASRDAALAAIDAATA